MDSFRSKEATRLLFGGLFCSSFSSKCQVIFGVTAFLSLPVLIVHSLFVTQVIVSCEQQLV